VGITVNTGLQKGEFWYMFEGFCNANISCVKYVIFTLLDLFPKGQFASMSPGK